MKRIPPLIILLFFSCIISAQSPTIVSFSPVTGTVGTLVTITGTNLSNPAGLSIGNVSALSISDDGATLVGYVMPGATDGPVYIVANGDTAMAANNFIVIPTPYPGMQQGAKLVGTGVAHSSYGAQQGYSVAISADGNTAMVGAPGDNNNIGAPWVYVRNSGVWTQQGNKLAGAGSIAGSQQGMGVALSADGNTAIVGAQGDNSNIGAAWIWIRNNGVWTQQGNKLVGTGAVGHAFQGVSVAMSADGNTAVVGGEGDNGVGAVWVFTRTTGIWTQQGGKLVGTGYTTGNTLIWQGVSTAISADGNTILEGGYGDNNGAGAAWVFARSGNTWTQQGNKLVGAGAVNNTNGAYQGSAVALSADGNTAIVGGEQDSSNTGAAWVYTRTGGVWTQQGNKLVGLGAVGHAYQGTGVSLSADGNTAIVGGNGDNSAVGAAWIYNRAGGMWVQQYKITGSGQIGHSQQGFSAAMSANGTTTIIGAQADSSIIGAAWIFVTGPPPPIYTIINDTICQGDSAMLNGQAYYTTGSYSDTIITSLTDRITTLNLVVIPYYTSLIKQRICQGDTLLGHTAAGVYNDTVHMVGGCDSIITLELQVDTLPEVVSVWQTGDTLHTLAGYDIYNWYQDSATLLTSGRDSAYVITHTGNYHVTITNDSVHCVKRSGDYLITYSGIERTGLERNYLTIYPNPAQNTATITWQPTTPNVDTRLAIYDLLGREVNSLKIDGSTSYVQIDISGLGNGLYLVKLFTANGEVVSGKMGVVR